ncbi:aliphatic nitrilase [Aspergillus sclerotiicarbonarius CBS 121057]|uniref:nitrilase n=1 Tax=Aspergillus sclerotiicarbonarius (strain CBS 121057 / IBT 28362) TaxID=1448318 RepID=A0A319EL93_ASPSB|nr:aliphatic nitrilase [Aspergillus sclerotiicarbonarius CBS 121057]
MYLALLALIKDNLAPPDWLQEGQAPEQGTRSIHEVVASWDLTNLTLAAVRAPPVNWPLPIMNKDWDGVSPDLNGTVDLAVKFIKEASQNNARVVAFPEVWFPGYPKGVINDEVPNPWFEYHVKDYIQNSLVVGSDNWNKLAQAAVDYEVYLGFGFSEKADDHLYIAQALIAPDGEVLIHRHKLRPTAQERDLWTDGQLDEIYAVSTPIGRVGMLSCYEHITPEALFSLQAQTEDIHIGSWPYTPDFGNQSLTYESAEAMTTFASFYAAVGETIVMQSTVGTASIFPAGQSANYTQIVANVSFEEHPLVYRVANATGFRNTTYNKNGEFSWGSLQGINRAFPAYIPKDMGTYVLYHEQNLQTLSNESLV